MRLTLSCHTHWVSSLIDVLTVASPVAALTFPCACGTCFGLHSCDGNDKTTLEYVLIIEWTVLINHHDSALVMIACDNSGDGESLYYFHPAATQLSCSAVL